MLRRLAAALLTVAAWLAAVVPSMAVDDPATRVVFTSGCDVWVAPLSGDSPQNLTQSAGCEMNPTISRTGRYVAWNTVGAGAGIAILDRTTGALSSIPAGQSPDFSPVSDDIAFTVSEAGMTDVFVAALDGTGRRKLTTDVDAPADGNRFPKWSADGTEILFSRGVGAPFCRVNRGGYDDIYPSYRLASVTLSGAITEVLAEPLTAFWSGQRGGGVFAYVRQALEPAGAGGYCVKEPTALTELVVNGVVREGAAARDVSVSPNGEVVYQAGNSVRYIPADGGPARTLFVGGDPDIANAEMRDLRIRVRITGEVDGPGRVQIRPGDADCRDECVEGASVGETVTISAVPDEPNDGFVAFRNCPGTVTYGSVGTCRFEAQRDIQVIAVFDPLPSYAPLLIFESGERHWPMNPGDFVRKSSLAFANPDGPHGRGCPRKDVQVVARGRVVSSWLARGRYSYRYCSGHPRARPPRPAGRVRLTTAQLTAPSLTQGKAAVRWGGGRWGFYLNLDNRLWAGRVPPGCVALNAVARSCPYPNGPDVYYEYQPRKWVVYWLFYGRNFHNVATFQDRHEGDWERVAVRLNGRNQATEAAYWQHYCQPQRISWSRMTRDGAIDGVSHPKVYVTRGAHASYHTAGATRFPCRPTRGGFDSHRGGGVNWETWQRGNSGLRDARRASWYGFGGSWGSKTSTGDSAFWGPLGPGRHKRPEPPGWG